MGDAATLATTVRDGWVVWEVPGKPVSVRLSVDVVSRLGMAVREGFKALPRRGLETGGLLIGTRKDGGGQTIVEVEDFEAVESEHAAGPSYLLSEADRRLLEARIATHGTSGKKPSVVGFYRSHTRNGFGITMEDEYVFSNFFRKSSDVFLLIKSNENAPPTGGFLIREGGKILSDTPYVQFAFSSEFALRAAKETPAPPAPAPVPVCVPQTVAAPAPQPSAAPIPPPRVARLPQETGLVISRRALLAAAVVAVLLAAVSVAMWRRAPVSAPAGAAAPLALSVSNSGSGLRLSWDHRASQRASQAILWIRDGEAEQKVELDAKQLNEGSIAYWPRSSDVNFRLQLLVPGSPVTESVRSIGGPSRPPEEPIPIEASIPVLPEILPVPAVRRAVQTGAVSRQRYRPFELSEPAVRQASIPEPPAVDPMVVPALPNGVAFLRPIAPVRRPVVGDDTDSYLRVKVEPVQRDSRNFPLVGKRHRRPNYVPPAPVREPSVPGLLARNLEHPVNIDVKVYVNLSGKVEYSEVLSKVNSDERDLAAAAVFSARKCEFVPAREGSASVPGEVIFHYEFGPLARAAKDSQAAMR